MSEEVGVHSGILCNCIKGQNHGIFCEIDRIDGIMLTEKTQRARVETNLSYV